MKINIRWLVISLCSWTAFLTLEKDFYKVLLVGLSILSMGYTFFLTQPKKEKLEIYKEGWLGNEKKN